MQDPVMILYSARQGPIQCYYTISREYEEGLRALSGCYVSKERSKDHMSVLEKPVPGWSTLVVLRTFEMYDRIYLRFDS